MKTLEWQAGPTNTNMVPSTQPMRSLPSVDLDLLRQGRKRKVIRGDGNCFFRALAHITYRSEDNHATVRRVLVTFISNNKPVFLKYVTSETFEEHVATVSRQGAWGTQVELYAAASYYQLPIYIFSPHPKSNKYRWLLFEPEQRSQLFYGKKCASAQPNFITQCITHIELCHTTGDHFDCVLTLNNTPSTSHPQLDHSSSYINIC